jgi:XTP/dITP diphosphohydrolase
VTPAWEKTRNSIQNNAALINPLPVNASFLSSHKFRRNTPQIVTLKDGMKKETNHDSVEMKQKLEAFERLLNIMDDLRTGCPWDREQTMESLRHLTIEEVYELSDAILDKDMDGIRKEIGDLMLHLVFYAKIGSETNDFTIKDVLDGISEKLIYRHPHIYGDVEVSGPEEVKDNWEKLKLKEGKKSVLEGVPQSMPPLVKAYRIQEKVKGVGFEWEYSQQVWDKVQEEMNELKAEVEGSGSKEKMEDELGDLLFALVNYARYIGINPEDALERTNKKFIRRFQFIETESRKDGKEIQHMSLEEMDVYWDKAKDLGY